MPAQPLTDIVASHTTAHPRANVEVLERAYETASRLHAGRQPRSGVDYVTPSLAVALIVADLGMDTTTLAAALLQDTIEEADYTLAELRADFGNDVASVVDGLVKLDKVKLGDSAKAETIRTMLVSTARDPRVLVVRLADRLHSMRTLSVLPPPEREQKARETLEILAPLAHRLRLNTVKCELEDLSFATLSPERFEKIRLQLIEQYPQRDNVLREVVDRLRHDLRSAKIDAKVTGRLKHLYSIHQKMVEQSLAFEQIHDLVGVRILVDTVHDCHAVLGVIHASWQQVPGGFEDYITTPKMNLYQSLHTTVTGPTGKPVEMQIRTHTMHSTAEYGIAAYWGDKEGEDSTMAGPPAADTDGMSWLRQLLDWQPRTSDPGESLDALRHDLSNQEPIVHQLVASGDAAGDKPSVQTPAPQPHRRNIWPCVEAEGYGATLVTLARCCTPIPGDTIFGSMTRSGGINVHREDCTNSQELKTQTNLLVEVSWKLTAGSMFLVAIQVEASDRHQLLADITRALSEQPIDLLSATVTTTGDQMVVSRISFEMADPKHLGRLLNAVRNVEGVVDVYSVTADEKAAPQPDSPT
ncbi:hypothetical protein Rhe02_65410 [Rhizocola hellebori]|uniref:Bifunctional (P)ppGpp synthetase/guanosine-3',5'-bis(Diphosphate) 3'-pyrophosphohydrolase n=1 Tax=Rhizocola hellebori TaxID=1392758 RepID=A0A8J3QCY0_9ACTN|nr:HD domain-containing protein [Rhizocola hellebori]GIH08474.1 hypothetical protein Rhe02_65410 [Rhizocola hellebori]